MMRGFSVFTALLICLGTMATAQIFDVRYICNVDGQRGILSARLEVIGGTGIVSGVNGDFGVIGDQGYNVWVNGELRTNTAYFTFSGENRYADFFSQTGGGRFRVEWVPQPGGLIVVVDPQGAATQYYCEAG